MMTAVLVLGGCGKAADKTTISDSASGTDSIQTASGPSMEEEQVLPASSAGSDVSVSSSPKADDKELTDAFDALMDEVKNSIFPGSAGSSLNAASSGADILTWYAANRSVLSSEQITLLRDAYLSSQVDQNSFTEQLNAVAESISGLDSETCKDELSDAGWSGTVTWTADDCTLVSQALMSDTAAAAAAVSDLQLIRSQMNNGIWDADTAVTRVDAHYQQLSFDETGYSAGDLSAYAAGSQAPSIRYADLSGIIDPAYTPDADDSYAVALPSFLPLSITDDSGRGYSSLLLESGQVKQNDYDPDSQQTTITWNDQVKTMELTGIDVSRTDDSHGSRILQRKAEDP